MIGFSSFIACLSYLINIALQWIALMSFDFAKRKATLFANSALIHYCIIKSNFDVSINSMDVCNTSSSSNSSNSTVKFIHNGLSSSSRSLDDDIFDDAKVKKDTNSKIILQDSY